MSEAGMDRIKAEVKREFSRRKKVEAGLKLGNVYDDVAKRAGYRDWNEYSAMLKKT